MQLIKENTPFEVLNTRHRPLVREIQSALCHAGYLDPKFIVGKNPGPAPNEPKNFDGIIGRDTEAAISRFFGDGRGTAGESFNIGALTPGNVKDVLEIKFKPKYQFINLHQFIVGFDPMGQQLHPFSKVLPPIIKWMMSKGHHIDVGSDGANIVYIEGMNIDGALNNDAADLWNDVRLVFDIHVGGIPRLLHVAEATTEPGKRYTLDPMNKLGAARIAFGQYKAWTVGVHNGKHTGLIQSSPVLVHRDLNKDGKRNPKEPTQVGRFGINQHSTFLGFEGEKVGGHSAGCAVGRDFERHKHFINTCENDGRYRANRGYEFVTAFIPGDAMMLQYQKGF